MTTLELEKLLLDLIPGRHYDLARIAKALGCFTVEMDARERKVVWWITKKQ